MALVDCGIMVPLMQRCIPTMSVIITTWSHNEILGRPGLTKLGVGQELGIMESLGKLKRFVLLHLLCMMELQVWALKD
jgi:hypothetical protein